MDASGAHDGTSACCCIAQSHWFVVFVCCFASVGLRTPQGVRTFGVKTCGCSSSYSTQAGSTLLRAHEAG